MREKSKMNEDWEWVVNNLNTENKANPSKLFPFSILPRN
jgi:hypothetical protein